jgi:hypothetical protein
MKIATAVNNAKFNYYSKICIMKYILLYLYEANA